MVTWNLDQIFCVMLFAYGENEKSRKKHMEAIYFNENMNRVSSIRFNVFELGACCVTHILCAVHVWMEKKLQLHAQRTKLFHFSVYFFLFSFIFRFLCNTIIIHTIWWERVKETKKKMYFSWYGFYGDFTLVLHLFVLLPYSL